MTDSELEYLRGCAALAGLERYIGGAAGRSLASICDTLHEFSDKFNLTAIREPRAVIEKHIIDSLFAAGRLSPDVCSVIDIGAGAGFPALPIAAVLPDVNVLALDLTEKKASYINMSAQRAEITNITAVCARAEELSRMPEHREAYDAAVSRAVARLGILLELCVPFVRVGGAFIAMKARGAEEEISEAKNAAKCLSCELSEVFDYTLPDSHETRKLLIYRKIAHQNALYPRKYSKIKASPL